MRQVFVGWQHSLGQKPELEGVSGREIQRFWCFALALHVHIWVMMFHAVVINRTRRFGRPVDPLGQDVFL